MNHMYGTGRRAGIANMTFTSGPGFSLMLEGISYMVGSELPGVFVNVMRGGPGLGNIAPEQSDVKLALPGPSATATATASPLMPQHPPGDAGPLHPGLRAELQVPEPPSSCWRTATWAR